MLTRLVKFKTCLSEQRFYDAHEALEEVWYPKRFEKNAEVQLLKGFINAAVSFELYKRGKKEQSKKVWANYLKYRHLLYKITKNQKEFYQLSRFVEQINHQNNVSLL